MQWAGSVSCPLWGWGDQGGEGSGSQIPSGPQRGLLCGRAFTHREEPPTLRGALHSNPDAVFLGVFVSGVECTHAHTSTHPHLRMRTPTHTLNTCPDVRTHFYTQRTAHTSTGIPHTRTHTHPSLLTLSHAYSCTHVPHPHAPAHTYETAPQTDTYTRTPYTHTPAHTSARAHLRSHTSVRARLHTPHTYISTSTPTRTFTHTHTQLSFTSDLSSQSTCSCHQDKEGL